MGCYVGIDLHATNSVVVVSDEADRVLYQKRLRNELSVILMALDSYRPRCRGSPSNPPIIGTGSSTD